MSCTWLFELRQNGYHVCFERLYNCRKKRVTINKKWKAFLLLMFLLLIPQKAKFQNNVQPYCQCTVARSFYKKKARQFARLSFYSVKTNILNKEFHSIIGISFVKEIS